MHDGMTVHRTKGETANVCKCPDKDPTDASAHTSHTFAAIAN